MIIPKNISAQKENKPFMFFFQTRIHASQAPTKTAGRNNIFVSEIYIFREKALATCRQLVSFTPNTATASKQYKHLKFGIDLKEKKCRGKV